jgi:hypothetical protein
MFRSQRGLREVGTEKLRNSDKHDGHNCNNGIGTKENKHIWVSVPLQIQLVKPHIVS